MNLPIVIVEKDNGDVFLTETLEMAEATIEWQDVDEYEVYDVTGQILKPEIYGKSFLRPAKVKLTPSGDFQVESLRNRLLRYLKFLKVSVPDQNAEPVVLISLILQRDS